jgi:ribonuclease P protein component
MRNGEDFRHTVRRGARAARPTLVVHAGRSSHPGVRVGFVVSKSIGGAVRRNAVKRRLRHLALERLAETPEGTDVVVRALPAAASDPQRVPADLASAWSTAVGRTANR